MRGYHRSGWNYVVGILKEFVSRHEGKYILDTFVDATFNEENRILEYVGVLPYKKKWIGFIHHTPNIEYSNNNVVTLIHNPVFIQSLECCCGIIVLSNYLKNWLRKNLITQRDIPIHYVCHPTEIPPIRFSFEQFINNSRKKIVQVGGWMRDSYGIYRLNGVSGLQKCALRGKDMWSHFKPNEFDFTKYVADIEELYLGFFVFDIGNDEDIISVEEPPSNPQYGGNHCMEGHCGGNHCMEGHCRRGHCSGGHCGGNHCMGGHCRRGHCSGGHCSGGHCSGGHCSGGHCSGGHCSGGHCSGGHCSGGHCSGGHCSGGHCSGGHCSGGHCSGGHCSGGHCSGGHCSGGHCGGNHCSGGHCGGNHCSGCHCRRGHCSGGHCRRGHCSGGHCRRSHCHESDNKFREFLTNKYVMGMINYIETFEYDQVFMHLNEDVEFTPFIIEMITENYNSVDIIEHLSDIDYDILLSENIVFLNLVNSSAVNTLIECIVRNTPLLVNKLPAISELLGEDYPFYYSDYEEAHSKISDIELVKQTHEYMIKLEKGIFRKNHLLEK